MVPIFQDKFSDEKTGAHGNCFRVCLASIFEVPLLEVPAFEDMERGEWHRPFFKFCKDKGYEYNGCGRPIDSMKDMPGVNGYFIVAGLSTRGLEYNRQHSVVYRAYDAVMVHDPHPSGDGLREPEFFFMIDQVE